MFRWGKAWAPSILLVAVATGGFRTGFASIKEPCLGKLYEIIAAPHPGIEFVSNQRVDPTDPGQGRRITVRIPADIGSQRFERGFAIEATENNPELARKFGYSVDRQAGTFTYLDADGQNVLIRKLRAASDPDAPAVELWNFNGEGEAPEAEFADQWVLGRATIARYGRLHHHDTGVHALGYLLLPGEVVRANRAYVKALRALSRDPALAKLHPIFEDMLQRSIAKLDRITADLTMQLAHTPSRNTPANLALRFEQLSQGTETIRRARSEFDHLSPTERQAMERILAADPHPTISPARIDEIAAELVQRAWKHAAP